MRTNQETIYRDLHLSANLASLADTSHLILLPRSFLSRQGLSWLLGCVLLSGLSSLCLVWLVRLSLRLLFSYQSWIYLERHQMKNPPLHIKMWSMLVFGLLNLKVPKAEKKKPMLYSYQGTLPAMPVPAVEKTIQRYVRGHIFTDLLL